MSASVDKTQQRLTLHLSDESRLELTFTPSAARASLDLERLKAQLILDLEPKPARVAPPDHRGIVGKSRAMQDLFRTLSKVAPTHATVLITGENGTGKELIARALHEGSTRANKPFIAANCSAFNDNLLESELFGHRRGAFTGAVTDKRGLFEEADGGTFLLDEVGDMTPALQAKLLRVLQEGTFMPVGGTQTKKVDVRIIAATNRDLAAMMHQGTFREDLYYRLNVVALRTPALRDRGEDLDRLVQHFLDQLNERHGRAKALHPETAECLRRHRWPGNVRELQNEMERLWVLSGDERVIGPEHLNKSVRDGAGAQASALQAVRSPTDSASGEAIEEPLARSLERFERSLLERALRKVQGNRTKAAQILGVSRRNLIRKLAQLGLSGAEDANAAD